MQTAVPSRPFLPADAQHVPASAEFGLICRLLLRNDDFASLADLAEQRQLPGRVQRALRSAVPAAGLTGGANDALRDISFAFAETLAEISVFDRLMRDGAVRLPSNTTRIIAATTLPQAHAVGEGKAKPLTSLALTASDTALHKAVAALIISVELARSSEPGAAQMITRLLRNAVAYATDVLLLDQTAGLLAGVVATASGGDPLADISALLTGIDLGEASRPYFLVEPVAAKKLCVKNAAGVRVFPDMTPMGGQMVGVETLVSSALPDGYFVALDAAGVGLADNGIEPSRARHADAEMSTTPTADGLAPVGATGMTSLWQNNLVGIRAEREISWKMLRPRAISAVSGVAY
jgi:hypothetical protein